MTLGRSPELRLDAVVTSHGDTRYRALLAAKLLALGGRTDVPVGEGSGSGQLAPDRRGQQGWLDGYAPSDYSGVYRTDGAALMVETILASTDRPGDRFGNRSRQHGRRCASNGTGNRDQRPFRRYVRGPATGLSRQQHAGAGIQRIPGRGLVPGSVSGTLAFAEDLLEMQTIRLAVRDDGLTFESDEGSSVHAAMGWRDLPAFRDLLISRLIGAA